MPYRGLLDRLDRIDQLLLDVDLEQVGAGDKRVIRANQISLTNARMELHEARRMIERAGQETKT